MKPLSNFVIFILTKTKFLRWVGMTLAGLLVTWHIVKNDQTVERRMQDENGQTVIVKETQENLIGEALTALLIGAASLLIEGKKDKETKKTQELIDNNTPEGIEVKQDGLAGPETRRAILVALPPPPSAPVTSRSVALNPNHKG